MIECNGFASVAESSLRVVPIPVIICEANSLGSFGWAGSTAQNAFKILPLQAQRTSGGYMSVCTARIVVDQNNDSDEPLAVGWVFHNHTQATASIVETNCQMVARYAIERIETFEREF